MAKEEKKLFVNTFSGPFLNTDWLVVEYDDILQIPEFFLLCTLRESDETINRLFDLSVIRGITDADELIQWYINRPYKELFANIPPTDELLHILDEIYGTEEGLEYKLKSFSNNFIEDMLKNNIDILNSDMDLNFFQTLRMLMNTSIVGHTIIFSKYSENICAMIEENLKEKLNEEVKVVHCTDLTELIKKEEGFKNATFILSDIEHVLEIKEAGVLNGSSIVLADSYGYNLPEDEKERGKEEGVFKVDIEELLKEYLFKINFFDNYYE